MKLVRLLERSSKPSAGASHSASLLRLRFSRFVNSLFSLPNEILRTLAPGYAATRVRNMVDSKYGVGASLSELWLCGCADGVKLMNKNRGNISIPVYR